MTSADNILDGETLRQLSVGVLRGLPPYEFAMYVYLLHAAQVADPQTRRFKIGKRTLVSALGRGTRSDSGGVTSQVSAGSQGRPSASMTRVSKKCLPCFAAVER